MSKKFEDKLKKKKLADFILANKTRGVSYAECARYMDVWWKTIKNLIKNDFPKEEGELLNKFVIDGRRIDKSIPINYPEGYELEKSDEQSVSIGEVYSKPEEVEISAEEVESKSEEVEDFAEEADSKPEEVEISDEKADLKPEEVGNSTEEVDSSPDESNVSVGVSKTKLFPIKLSECTCVEKPTISKPSRNWVIDLTKFHELTLGDILKVIELNKNKYNPKFVLFESDITYLNDHKNIDLAQKLLQFIALGKDFISFKKGQKPEGSELAKFCAENGYQLITGSPYMVAWCKVYRVWYNLAERVKNKYKSPFNGTGVVGIDTCVFGSVTKAEVSKFGKVLMSDLQLEEIQKRDNEFFNTIAIYGEFKFFEDYDSTQSNDWNIIKFFSSNKVDKLFTADYGFMAFARFYGINCEYVSQKADVPSSILEACKKTKFNATSYIDENLISKDLDIDEIVFSKSNKYYVYPYKNQYIIKVYDRNYKKLTNKGNKLEVRKNYYICIEVKNTNRIILGTIDCLETQLVKVIFAGRKQDVPDKFKKFTY